MISFFVLPFVFSNTTFAQSIFDNNDFDQNQIDTSKKTPTTTKNPTTKEVVPLPTALDNDATKFTPENTNKTLEDVQTELKLAPDNALEQKKETDTTYTPLAKLPGLGTFDSKEPCALGRYLNILVKILIGFSAVLAMVMIVIGGIEYMTSELVSSKKAGIERITNAILGLLIALTAFLILNTINPNLLNVCLDQLPEARVTVLEEDRETYSEASKGVSYNIPEGTIAGNCTEGIKKVETSFTPKTVIYVCKSIATNVEKLINTAALSSIKLSGWGAVSKEGQIQKRINNCGGNTQYNIYEKPNKQCQPPTARPGTSRHESGKAIDFLCDGVLIGSQDNKCFVWLKNNASKFGLKNYAAEPWHWSTDGG